MTDHPVVTVRVLTPVGPLRFMAEPVMQGATMLLKGLPMQDLTPNAVDMANLMVIARVVMERMDLDGLVIEGAIRSTGAKPAIDRVASGSPAVFALRTTLDRTPLRTIDATEALARRGLSMLRAKRLTEDLLEGHRVFAELALLEDEQAFVGDMAACGIAAVLIKRDAAVDVRALRERLNLTREQFAVRYGLEVETLRNWETGKCEPDTTARSYLRVIANAPEAVEEAYATPSLD